MDSDASHTGCQWSLPANNKPYDAIKCQQCTLSIRQYRCSISWMRPIATNGVTWSVCLSRPWPLQKRLNQSWCSSGFDRRGPKEHVLDRSPDPHSLKECPETGRQKSQTPLIRFVAQQAVQQVHNKSKKWSLATTCCGFAVALQPITEENWHDIIYDAWLTSYIKIVICDSSEITALLLTMANAVLQLSTSNLIDAYQNETCQWDTTKNSTEEEKELAWSRLSVLFGTSVGNIRSSTLHCLFVG